MENLLRRVWRLPTRRKLVLLEAGASTLAAWAMIRMVPYRLWRAALGVPLALNATPLTGASARSSNERVLGDIAWAHERLARRLGRFFTCLMLAMSARSMLRRRHLSSVLILGVKREGTAAPGADALHAHAWVLSQGYEIVGGEQREGHMPVAAYGLRERTAR
jgi:Transglutaminase-like superfamily